MSDYTDNLGLSTASNRTIQPGKSVDYPSQGTPMDPADHPATSMPSATQDHSGTVLGTDTLKRAFAVDKLAGGNAMRIEGADAENIDTIVRGVR